jgi:large subunit ribosomal protein L25
MAEVTVLKAKKRVAAGSAAARRLRGAGAVPAEVYGEKGNTSIQLNTHEFTLMLKRHGEHQIMALEVDDKSAGHVLIKAVQHDPIHGQIIHADFITVSMDKPVEVNLPIVLTGEPAGVKNGGILEQQLSSIEVSCLPGDMVDSIPVDVSGLLVGEHLCVKDLKLPAGFKVLADGEIVVASVALPGAERSEAAAEGEAAAAAPAAKAATPAKASAPAAKAAPGKAAAPAKAAPAAKGKS